MHGKGIGNYSGFPLRSNFRTREIYGWFFHGKTIDSIVPGVDMKQIRILFCDQYNHCLACH